MIIDLKDAAKDLATKAPDLVRAGPGKALEAEILFGLALAATAHGTVVARTHKGHKLNRRFRLRGAPGKLWADDAAGAGPSYFAVTIKGVEFELHNGLEMVGASEVEHEVDVAAILRSKADAARATPSLEIDGPPVLGVELKAYKISATVDKNLVRAFFACIIDFVPAWAIPEINFGGRGESKRTYRAAPRAKDQFWLLTTGGISGPASKFAEAYDIRVIDHVEALKFIVATKLMAQRLKKVAEGDGAE